jgi:Inorganic pyrophosphatase
MTDEKGGGDKVLCIPAGDPRQEHLRDIHHLPDFDRLEIQHFFQIHKELEPGKSVEGSSWAERRRRRGRDRGTPGVDFAKSRANAPSAPLKTAPHVMTGPAADVPSTMTVRASCVREVTPSFR